MDIYLHAIMEILKEKYPDAVETVVVNNRTIQEGIGTIALQLQEIEPETEIFAAMSPTTKKVYLYLDKLGGL